MQHTYMYNYSYIYMHKITAAKTPQPNFRQGPLIAASYCLPQAPLSPQNVSKVDWQKKLLVCVTIKVSVKVSACKSL